MPRPAVRFVAFWRVSPCLGAAMTERPLCLPEIDAGIVAARWKWLHATWADDTTAVAAFRAEIDGLLEQRHAITTAGTMIGRN